MTEFIVTLSRDTRLIYQWPRGLPAKGTRVSLDCGAKGFPLGGSVIEVGPEIIVVRWDNGIEQFHPVLQLMPEKKIDKKETTA